MRLLWNEFTYLQTHNVGFGADIFAIIVVISSFKPLVALYASKPIADLSRDYFSTIVAMHWHFYNGTLGNRTVLNLAWHYKTIRFKYLTFKWRCYFNDEYDWDTTRRNDWRQFLSRTAVYLIQS